MHLRGVLVAALSICLSSCIGVPLREIGISGQLPPAAAVSFAAAKAFAHEIVAALPVRHIADSPPSVIGGVEKGGMISLSSKQLESVAVAVFANRTMHSLDVIISGDIESNAARVLEVGIRDVFQRIYPGQPVTHFQRRQGLMGP